ncbi:response regulator [Marinobacterium aestuariivivens]|uniref:Response regulator n=1 Tax=Marinobacterium aestuariivivens TaxID=1698799 RepID=A0ABW1ZVY0_9GAMM
MTIRQDDICTSRKAAELLGVSARTVQLWADAGVIASWKTPGGHRRFSLTDVHKLAQELRSGAGPVLPGPGASDGDKASPPPLKVLVVEDESTLLRLYELTLKSWHLPLDLHLADNGYTGLLTVGQVEPQLLLLDLNLPNIDGFQMISALKQSGLLDRMELMVISALEENEVLAGMPVGVECRVLPKPVPFELIRERLESLLER